MDTEDIRDTEGIKDTEYMGVEDMTVEDMGAAAVTID
jgi:hypothetical protein